MAQFMVEYSMARVLERFWKRAILFTRGILAVPVGRHGRSLSESYRTQYKAIIKNADNTQFSDAEQIKQTGFWTIEEGSGSDPWAKEGTLAGRAGSGTSGGDRRRQTMRARLRLRVRARARASMRAKKAAAAAPVRQCRIRARHRLRTRTTFPTTVLALPP